MEALSSIQVCAPSDFLFYLHRSFAQPCSKIQLVHMIGSQIRDFELAGDFLLAIQQAPGGKAGLLVGRAEACRSLQLDSQTFPISLIKSAFSTGTEQLACVLFLSQMSQFLFCALGLAALFTLQSTTDQRRKKKTRIRMRLRSVKYIMIDHFCFCFCFLFFCSLFEKTNFEYLLFSCMFPIRAACAFRALWRLCTEHQTDSTTHE